MAEGAGAESVSNAFAIGAAEVPGTGEASQDITAAEKIPLPDGAAAVIEIPDAESVGIDPAAAAVGIMESAKAGTDYLPSSIWFYVNLLRILYAEETFCALSCLRVFGSTGRGTGSSPQKSTASSSSSAEAKDAVLFLGGRCGDAKPSGSAA